LRHLAKFCKDRSNRSRDMADFRFYKMAAVRHLGLVLCMLGSHKEYLVVFVTVKNFCCNRCSNFDSMQILIFCTLSLKTPIHAPKIGVFGGFYPQNVEQYERDHGTSLGGNTSYDV